MFWVAPVNAQEDEASVDERTRTCISTRRLRHTVIVDDRNVLFYLSSRTILHNVLRQTCPGLKQIGTFAFTTTTGRICKGDGISPISGHVWGAVRPVPSCWLGIHRQITPEQADAMRDAVAQKSDVPPMPLPVPEPSEIGVEDDEPESPES